MKDLISLMGFSTAKELKKSFVLLMKSIKLETKLQNLGLKKMDLKVIVKHGFNPDRVKNNPRLLTREALIKILYRIYK
jgi:alcohol dehydrogenase class IV